MDTVEIRCTRCGRKLYSYPAVNKGWKYGSPLKVCKGCGQKYIDTRYHETAIEGAAPDALDVRKGIVCIKVGFFFAAVTAFLTFLSIYFGGFYYLTAVFLILMGVLMIIVGIIQVIDIKSGMAERRIKKYLAESEQRLMNNSYVQELIAMGYYVPNTAPATYVDSSTMF